MMKKPVGALVACLMASSALAQTSIAIPPKGIDSNKKMQLNLDGTIKQSTCQIADKDRAQRIDLGKAPDLMFQIPFESTVGNAPVHIHLHDCPTSMKTDKGVVQNHVAVRFFDTNNAVNPKTGNLINTYEGIDKAENVEIRLIHKGKVIDLREGKHGDIKEQLAANKENITFSFIAKYYRDASWEPATSGRISSEIAFEIIYK